MPSGRARGAAALLAVIGTLVAANSTALAIIWAGVIVPLAWKGGVLRRHLTFIVFVMVPLSAALLVVWGWLVGAPPSKPMGSDLGGGLQYAAVIALRLAILGGIGQLCFLTIPTHALPYTFRQCGLKGDALIIALGAMALIPEMAQRADQVLTARLARGLASNRTIITKLRQFPYLLRPLLAWSLRASIQRSEYWHQRELLARIDVLTYTRERASWGTSAACLVVAAGWAVFSLWQRWV